MGRLIGLAALTFVGWSLPAQAGPIKLVGTKITEALAGNTLVGDWDGASYRQYFDPSGRTIYDAKGGEPLVGTWRVNGIDELCQTVPPNTQESCYDMFRAGNTIYWVTPNSGLRHPSVIVKGRSLEFSSKTTGPSSGATSKDQSLMWLWVLAGIGISRLTS